MKKFYSFIIVAVAAMTFVCCGNSNKKAADTETVEVETVVEECCDSTCCGECCKGEGEEACCEGETAAENTEAAAE